MSKKSKHIEEAADEDKQNQPPEGYVLLKGDTYVPLTENDAAYQSASLESYYVSSKKEPAEVDESGSPVPHITNETIWYNIANGKTFLFTGKNHKGEAVWEETLFARRLVIDLEPGDDNGTLIGEIINSERQYRAEVQTKVNEEIEELTPEAPSFQELLNSV